LFAQDPANGIGNIRLPATIWADDGSDAGLEIQAGLLANDLKPKTVIFFKYMIFS